MELFESHVSRKSVYFMTARIGRCGICDTVD